MSLDVLTPKGQQSVRDEQAAVALFTGRFPQYAYLETPKQLAADVDGHGRAPAPSGGDQVPL